MMSEISEGEKFLLLTPNPTEEILQTLDISRQLIIQIRG